MQSSRAAMPLTRAGRPTARCGSAPMIMPMMATVTTCSALCWTYCVPTLMSSA